MKRRNFFKEQDAGAEEHPIDVAVEERLRLHALQRKIDRVQGELAKLLGKKRNVLQQLEVLQHERCAAREEAYFNLGFERGATAGRGTALRARDASPAQRELWNALVDAVLDASLSSRTKVTTLLEVAWAVMAEKSPLRKRASKINRR